MAKKEFVNKKYKVVLTYESGLSFEFYVNASGKKIIDSVPDMFPTSGKGNEFFKIVDFDGVDRAYSQQNLISVVASRVRLSSDDVKYEGLKKRVSSNADQTLASNSPNDLRNTMRQPTKSHNGETIGNINAKSKEIVQAKSVYEKPSVPDDKIVIDDEEDDLL